MNMKIFFKNMKIILDEIKEKMKIFFFQELTIKEIDLSLKSVSIKIKHPIFKSFKC